MTECAACRRRYPDERIFCVGGEIPICPTCTILASFEVLAAIDHRRDVSLIFAKIANGGYAQSASAVEERRTQVRHADS